jgi:hypothetical protein
VTKYLHKVILIIEDRLTWSCWSSILENLLIPRPIGEMDGQMWETTFSLVSNIYECWQFFQSSKNKMNCELMLTYDTPAYMFNVYKNQQSRQTGSRNVTGPKTCPTIWGTYMKLVTKYQISAINSCWEKYLGTDGRTEVKQ